MNNMKKYLLLSIFCLFPLLCFTTPIQAKEESIKQNQILKNADGLSPDVLKLGYRVYQKAYKKGLTSNKILTIVDYSKPSYERRLWVINLETNQVLFNTLVAHGMGSGRVKPYRFSNKSGTHASSLGVYLTGHTYRGKYGYALRLHGLEPQFNGKAFKRAIVMHKAWYVSDSFIKKYGYAGRTWGCFGLDEKVSRKVIQTIKDGSILFAYYPNRQWLKDSKFINNDSRLA